MTAHDPSPFTCSRCRRETLTTPAGPHGVICRDCVKEAGVTAAMAAEAARALVVAAPPVEVEDRVMLDGTPDAGCESERDDGVFVYGPDGDAPEIVAFNEAGYNSASVPVLDVIAWVKRCRPDLLGEPQGAAEEGVP